MLTTWQYNFDFQLKKNQEKYGKGIVLWLIGLSGSGKSTLCDSLSRQLIDENFRVVILDGDSFRTTISSDLGYTDADRTENLRRAAHVAKMFCDQGFIVLCSFITPLKQNRDLIKKILGESCKEIFINTPIEECIKRDPKGLYKNALAGKINHFTGVSAPFEPPENPDLIIDGSGPVDQQIKKVYSVITELKS